MIITVFVLLLIVVAIPAVRYLYLTLRDHICSPPWKAGRGRAKRPPPKKKLNKTNIEKPMRHKSLGEIERIINQIKLSEIE